jgi:hypothetical protein
MSDSRPSWPVRILKGFAMFWWDFLVGDTPELFVAVLVIIGAIAVISERAHANAAAIVALPVLAVVSLAWSLARVRRRANKQK